MTNGWNFKGKIRYLIQPEKAGGAPKGGAAWSARELATLRALARAGNPTRRVAKKLGRTAAAVQKKAMRAGVSFRAAKSAGPRRKKKSGARRKK